MRTRGKRMTSIYVIRGDKAAADTVTREAQVRGFGAGRITGTIGYSVVVYW